MKTIYYPDKNISKLREGDIVELENNTLPYGKMTVVKVTEKEVTFSRPYVVFDNGAWIVKAENFNAYRDHRGLNYHVWRDVWVFDNQVFFIDNIPHRVVGILDSGDVQLVNLNNNFPVIIHEEDLNWTGNIDWDSPDTLFWKTKEMKIVQYRKLYD